MNDRPDTHRAADESDRAAGPGSSGDGPESKGAPVAESHYLISEHDGVARVDIAADAEARPGPGPGQPEADVDARVTDR